MTDSRQSNGLSRRIGCGLGLQSIPHVVPSDQQLKMLHALKREAQVFFHCAQQRDFLFIRAAVQVRGHIQETGKV